MGFVHEEHGPSEITVETRRDSFYIHTGYEWGTWGESGWLHPEFLNVDAEHIIAALLGAFPDLPFALKEQETR